MQEHRVRACSPRLLSAPGQTLWLVALRVMRFQIVVLLLATFVSVRGGGILRVILTGTICRQPEHLKKIRGLPLPEQRGGLLRGRNNVQYQGDILSLNPFKVPPVNPQPGRDRLGLGQRHTTGSNCKCVGSHCGSQGRTTRRGFSWSSGHW